MSNKKKVIITGSQGLLGRYIAEKFLSEGVSVIGIDNESKYGSQVLPHEKDGDFSLHNIDLAGRGLSRLYERSPELFDGVELIVACAAKIGGVKYFHDHGYDIMSVNERINAETFDFARRLRDDKDLEKVIYLSSSMVYEQTNLFPTPEQQVGSIPQPETFYGFQKLCGEYFCRALYDQYGIPYTIIRPFNAVGVGEGYISDGVSHVLPDFVHRAIHSTWRDEFNIYGAGNQVRHFTHASDIARAVYLCSENKDSDCDAFNIASKEGVSIRDLAKLVWREVHESEPEIVNLKSFDGDVITRIPSVKKAKVVLGFECEVGLKDSIRELVDWFTGND